MTGMKNERLLVRIATPKDVVAIQEMIKISARALSADDYTPEQIEAAIQYVFGVDSELLEDQSYYVVERGGSYLACGGWSRRKTLFGGDHYAKRASGFLDPAKDAAKIRAFFVHPAAARQGMGAALLHHCEMQAKARGFTRAEMMATLPGVKLYAAFGYQIISREEYTLPNGVLLPFMKMEKVFTDASS